LKAWPILLAILLGCALSLPQDAHAHMMPAQQGTVNILGKSAFVVVSVPVAALDTRNDDDRDGSLSDSEITTHQTDLLAEIGRRFRIFNGAERGVFVPVLARAEADDHRHVTMLFKADFSVEPVDLRLETDLFGTTEEERQLTIRASRGKDGSHPENEAAVLRPSAPTHAFFRSKYHLFLDFLQLGFSHICSGLDHLLFLLTVLLGVAGRKRPVRSMVGVLTAFTVAHSVALVLALAGVGGLARVPPVLVEALIAATVIGAAAANLWDGKPTSTEAGARTRVLVRPEPPKAVRKRRARMQVVRGALVFACGLVHGLGFAGALAEMQVVGAGRAASVFGFNAGIELGQLAVVLPVLALGSAVRRALTPEQQRQALRVLSTGTALLGGVWFVSRVAS
jgi:hypothetical protein